MCRMFGVMGESTDQGQLTAMQRLFKGGPDEQNLRWGNGWALGHTRLAINGLLNGSQPYTAPGLHALFVGEIYNFKSLAIEYNLPLFDDDADGSVILPLYERFGTEFVRFLEGMFSIAIIDVRDRPALHLFTDCCAIKPVY